MKCSVPISPGATHQLVQDYLKYYGYGETLQAYDRAAGLADPTASTSGRWVLPSSPSLSQTGLCGHALPVCFAVCAIAGTAGLLAEMPCHQCCASAGVAAVGVGFMLCGLLRTAVHMLPCPTLF